MLGKIPGIAKADADKASETAIVVYDKSIFDASSFGGKKGRFSFVLAEVPDDAPEEAADDSDVETDSDESDEDTGQIEIEDLSSDSDAAPADDIMPSLDGPS